MRFEQVQQSVSVIPVTLSTYFQLRTLVDDSSTLLAFYSPDNPHQLWLSQSASDLEIQTQPSSGWRRVPTDKFYIDNAFQDREHTFWTLTFGKASTAVYRNGALVRRVSYRISGSDLSGQLVIGNSPIFHESWSGVLHGLAVYNKALDPTQIERHYTSWRQRRAPTLDPKDACIALYLFDEHAGNVIHNKMGTGNDLYIPQKFVVLRQTLLDPVWRAFRWSGGFWKDTFINIAGFIPFGCFFFAYFSAWGMRSSGFRTALLGASVSLFIEITQAYLPTRDSSMSDVITNTIGAVLGVLAYRGIVARALDRVTLRIISVLNG